MRLHLKVKMMTIVVKLLFNDECAHIKRFKSLNIYFLFVVLRGSIFWITGDGSDLEEERRPGYVAITRAKDWQSYFIFLFIQDFIKEKEQFFQKVDS